MKNAIRLMLIFAVCGALALPGMAMADKTKTIAEVLLGPDSQDVKLGIPKGAKKLYVSLVNGSGRDKTKVTSARIKVNGQEVYGPSDFSAGKAEKNISIIRNVNVDAAATEVSLEVTIKGKKGSELALTIRGRYDEEDEDPEMVTWYRDSDGDGVGDSEDIRIVEEDDPPGSGWVLLGGDCDNDDGGKTFSDGNGGCL